MDALGPSIFGDTADSSSSSNEELLATLDACANAARGWPALMFANQADWQSRVDDLVQQIDTARSELPVAGVFPGRQARIDYDTAIHAYGALKNQVTLTPDQIEPSSLDQLASAAIGSIPDVFHGLASAGQTLLVVVALLVVAYLFVPRFLQGAKR